MSADIRFPTLPSELEKRVRTATRAFLDKAVSDIAMVRFFFQYFFERLEPMYQDTPKVAQSIKKVLTNQQFAIVVPRLVEVTVFTKSVSELNFKQGVDVKDPTITFDGLKTVLYIILSNTTIFKAYMDKKLKIKKVPEILKWLAPIAAIQTDETLKRVQEQDLELISKLLLELGY
jgi:hydrogenase-4 membrane subunit HyfE